MKYIKFFKPPYVLLENVPGMTDGKEKSASRTITKVFLMLGYQVRTGILTADAYGVPQSRERVFFIAALPEVTLPEFPRPPHEAAKLESNSCYFVTRQYWNQIDKVIHCATSLTKSAYQVHTSTSNNFTRSNIRLD